MSSVKFIGLRCDSCKKPFLASNGDGVFFDESRKLHNAARLRGWLCRKWTLKNEMVDACPDCVPNFPWGRRIL